MPESLLTTEQVARYLNVDKFTVYRLVSQKKLPAFRVSNQWRLQEKDPGTVVTEKHEHFFYLEGTMNLCPDQKW